MNERIKNLLSGGAEIAGAAVGGAIGFFATGPSGAAAAGALGVATAKLLQDISHRALSHREEVRVGATASYAVDYIRQRLQAGETPRNDGFFSGQTTGTSPAEEIFEGVLLKAKNDHEEQKARYYGKLFSNVAFDIHCSRQEANYFLHVMERLTFLQLVLLNIFSNTNRFQLRSTRYQPGEQVSFAQLSILSATFDLFQQNLLRLQEPGAQHGEIALDLNQIRPAYTSLTVTGTRLFQLSGLSEIAQVDIEPVIKLFSMPSLNQVKNA